MEVFLGRRWFKCTLARENAKTIVVRLENGKYLKRHLDKHPIHGLEEERERIKSEQDVGSVGVSGLQEDRPAGALEEGRSGSGGVGVPALPAMAPETDVAGSES